MYPCNKKKPRIRNVNFLNFNFLFWLTFKKKRFPSFQDLFLISKKKKKEYLKKMITISQSDNFRPWNLYDGRIFAKTKSQSCSL